MCTWQLRPVKEGDEEFLAALHTAVRGASLAALPLPPSQLHQLLCGQIFAERQAYRADFTEAGHAIVLSAGESVGRIWVHRTEAEVRLVDILLLPSFQGKGIGSALITGLQAEAPPRPVTLNVLVHNTSAIRLYERLGFRSEAVTGMHLSMRWTQSANI